MLVLACSAPAPATTLVVVVSSDYAPGTELARVVVTTSDETGAAIATEDFTVAVPGSGEGVAIPFSLGVRPAAGPTRPLRLEVSGFANGAS